MASYRHLIVLYIVICSHVVFVMATNAKSTTPPPPPPLTQSFVDNDLTVTSINIGSHLTPLISTDSIYYCSASNSVSSVLSRDSDGTLHVSVNDSRKYGTAVVSFLSGYLTVDATNLHLSSPYPAFDYCPSSYNWTNNNNVFTFYPDAGSTDTSIIPKAASCAMDNLVCTSDYVDLPSTPPPPTYNCPTIDNSYASLTMFTSDIISFDVYNVGGQIVNSNIEIGDLVNDPFISALYSIESLTVQLLTSSGDFINDVACGNSTVLSTVHTVICSSSMTITASFVLSDQIINLSNGEMAMSCSINSTAIDCGEGNGVLYDLRNLPNRLCSFMSLAASSSTARAITTATTYAPAATTTTAKVTTKSLGTSSVAMSTTRKVTTTATTSLVTTTIPQSPTTIPITSTRGASSIPTTSRMATTVMATTTIPPTTTTTRITTRALTSPATSITTTLRSSSLTTDSTGVLLDVTAHAGTPLSTTQTPLLSSTTTSLSTSSNLVSLSSITTTASEGSTSSNSTNDEDGSHTNNGGSNTIIANHDSAGSTTLIIAVVASVLGFLIFMTVTAVACKYLNQDDRRERALTFVGERITLSRV